MEKNNKVCQSCQDLLNIDLKDWERNKARVRKEATKCEHSSSVIRYLNEKKQCIGANSLDSLITNILCDKKLGGCGKYNKLNSWSDCPPCPCENKDQNDPNNQNNPNNPNYKKQAPNNDKGLSGGVIAGLAIGGVAIVGIGGYLIWEALKSKPPKIEPTWSG